MKEKSPAFQFYPKDVLSDGYAMAMPAEAFGIYMRLLCYDWIDDGLPNDDKTLLKLGGYEHHDYQGNDRDHEDFNVVVSYIKPQFIEHPNKPGLLTNPRLLKERIKQKERSKESSKSGREGGLAKARNSLQKKPSESLAKPSSSSSSSITSAIKKHPPTPQWGDFDALWERYPKKDGRKASERSFKASVLSEKDWVDINTALDNYLKSETVLKGFIKNGATWFNNWRDWINYSEKKVTTLKREPKPSPDCEPCGASGTLPDGKKCWCWK